MLKQIGDLQSSPTKGMIDSRLREFMDIYRKGNPEWFSELCFCILTANSKAITAINIQNKWGYRGFMGLSQSGLAEAILKNKHRFHNTKARFIIEARKFHNIKSILSDKPNPEKREWIVENIKGLGYKEASHFLRNVGILDFAILDRHILNLMAEHNIIKRPKSITKDKYLRIEKIFLRLSKKMGMAPGELDMYMWYLKTGEVLK